MSYPSNIRHHTRSTHTDPFSRVGATAYYIGDRTTHYFQLHCERVHDGMVKGWCSDCRRYLVTDADHGMSDILLEHSGGDGRMAVMVHNNRKTNGSNHAR